MKKQYKIDCWLEVSGTVEVSAETEHEAKQKAYALLNERSEEAFVEVKHRDLYTL